MSKRAFVRWFVLLVVLVPWSLVVGGLVLVVGMVWR